MQLNTASQVINVFLECHAAIRRGDLINRESPKDKEFHFQGWFETVLETLRLNYDIGGRNKYPDYTLVHTPVGFELKGLAFPGRVASFDSNSQIPRGTHNGRDIVYVFGRYPAKPLRETKLPVVDLLLCHGSFLSADDDYEHKNRHVKGFGSYGDIMIRDRKMYVSPTPFALTENTEGQITLILPEGVAADKRLVERGELTRVETEYLVTGYSFNLETNDIKARLIPNPNAGKKHEFIAYRLANEPGPKVRMAEDDS